MGAGHTLTENGITNRSRTMLADIGQRYSGRGRLMNLRRWSQSGDRPDHRRSIEAADVRTMLRRAEEDAEKTSAIVRLIVFLSLAFVLLYAADASGRANGLTVVVGLYGLGAAAGLFLAWRGIVNPMVPYLFVTVDVTLVVIQVLLLARLMGMQPASPFALPAAALIFVILIYAALRYRPWLVIYAAILFVVSMEFGSFFLASDRLNAMTGMHPMGVAPHAGMTDILNYQILPLTIISLAAFILFVMGRRTRVLLLTSIEYGARTARLSRYFSPNVATRLAEGDTDQLLVGRRQLAAVLFVDIRDFTAIGETMAPAELGAFLSEYRQRLTEPVFARAGTVDKFIGDAIMIVFGSPIQGPDDAGQALHCAFEILDAAAQWSRDRQQAGQSPVSVGIGAHYGEVFAGALGSGQLLEFTVIGDTVNVAERLERLSREIDSSLVVSEALLDAMADASDKSIWRRLPPQHLKGHQQPVDVFCLPSEGALQSGWRTVPANTAN